MGYLHCHERNHLRELRGGYTSQKRTQSTNGRHITHGVKSDKDPSRTASVSMALGQSNSCLHHEPHPIRETLMENTVRNGYWQEAQSSSPRAI